MWRLWGKPSIKRGCWVIGTEKEREREAKVIREKVQSTVSQMCENDLRKLYLCKWTIIIKTGEKSSHKHFVSLNGF